MPSQYTKAQAISSIEDALGVMKSEQTKLYTQGIIDTFYMAGFLTKEEWVSYLERIPFSVSNA